MSWSGYMPTRQAGCMHWCQRPTYKCLVGQWAHSPVRRRLLRVSPVNGVHLQEASVWQTWPLRVEPHAVHAGDGLVKWQLPMMITGALPVSSKPCASSKSWWSLRVNLVANAGQPHKGVSLVWVDTDFPILSALRCPVVSRRVATAQLKSSAARGLFYVSVLHMVFLGVVTILGWWCFMSLLLLHAAAVSLSCWGGVHQFVCTRWIPSCGS